MTARRPDTVIYKGYEISAASQQLRDTGRWTTRAYVTRHKERQTTEKEVSAANTFATKEEADKHSLEFARQVIDGKIAGCTADDL